jgi:hypothetical protein
VSEPLPFARWWAARGGIASPSAPASPSSEPTPAAGTHPQPPQRPSVAAAERAAVQAEPEPPPPAAAPPPDAWLGSIAARLRVALAAGAVRTTDPAGYLVLTRRDGRLFTVAPHIVAELEAAGLLPALPDPVDEAAEDDPVEAAERAAVQAEPEPPPKGSPARAALDQRQAEMVAGLLEASRVRPSCFEGEATRPPPQGVYCSACKGRRWWIPRRPATDGTGPSGHWRCTTCRPAAGLRADQIKEIVT